MGNVVILSSRKSDFYNHISFSIPVAPGKSKLMVKFKKNGKKKQLN